MLRVLFSFLWEFWEWAISQKSRFSHPSSKGAEEIFKVLQRVRMLWGCGGLLFLAGFKVIALELPPRKGEFWFRPVLRGRRASKKSLLLSVPARLHFEVFPCSASWCFLILKASFALQCLPWLLQVEGLTEQYRADSFNSCTFLIFFHIPGSLCTQEREQCSHISLKVAMTTRLWNMQG